MKFLSGGLTPTLAQQLEETLKHIPGVRIKTVQIPEPDQSDHGMDFTLQVHVHQDTWTLHCQVKTHTEPRQIRAEVLKLLPLTQEPHTAVLLLGPFFSPQTQQILREHHISFLDFQGNCQIQFSTLYLERSGRGKPKGQKRDLKNLFSPRASQVLRTLMMDVHKKWLTKDLQEQTHVSSGMVSYVRQALLDQEWATDFGREGLQLTQPDKVLDAWKKTKPEKKDIKRYYTLSHGQGLMEQLKTLMQDENLHHHLALASYSAASLQAPYARHPTTFLYADPLGLTGLVSKLKLREVDSGENIIVYLQEDDHLLFDTVQVAGFTCTHPIQTCLDLHHSGERGQEAAEHLQQTLIEPLWKENT